MTRMLKTMVALCLGALLTGSACENKETEAALTTCKNNLATEQQKATTQQTTINELKAQLATANAKIGEMSKAAEAATNGKTGKSDEKAKAGEAKKEQAAKTEKKGKKK